MTNNYHYIIAGLPELLLKGENKDFSYEALRNGIYSWCSQKDRRMIDWLEFGNKDTNLSDFKKELRMNEVYYMLNKALC